jgi:hypothetical protein
VRSIELEALRSGGTTVDLSGEQSFLASGFAGAVKSSVKLKLGAPLAPFISLSSPKSASKRRQPRSLTATYRIARIDGSVLTSFSGSAEPSLCAPLAACGSSGTVRAAPLTTSGKATFFADAGAKRTSYRQLRAALGIVRGRRARGITVYGEAEWSRGIGSIAESYSGADGRSCNDSVPLQDGRLAFTFGRRRVFASYGRDDLYGAGTFRTRCPGPSLADVAHDHPLATGAVGLRAFRKQRVVIKLESHRLFDSAPFQGETRAALTVVLRRVRVSRKPSADDGLLVIRRAATG